MHRLAEFEHYIVRNISDVVYRALADRFEPIHKPLRRRPDLYVSNYPRCEPKAKLRILDLYNFVRQRRRKRNFGLIGSETLRLRGERLFGEYRNLAGNSESDRYREQNRRRADARRQQPNQRALAFLRAQQQADQCQ